MVRKVAFFLSILIIGFTVGYGGVVFAKHHHPIPGIDIPFDSAAYYSPTALDYADSPSTFALRQLTGSGTVFDYVRHLKNVLVGKNVTEWLKLAVQKTGIDILNSTPFPKERLEKTGTDISKMYAYNVDNTLTDDVVKLLGGHTFRSEDDLYDDDTYSFDNKEKRNAIQEETTDMIRTARNYMAQRDEQYQTYQHIMEDIENAAGEMQANQANAEAQAFAQAQQSQKNSLMGNIISLKMLQRRIEEDDQRAFQRSSDANMLHFPDPFHRSPVEQKEYDSTNPTQPKGFAPFK